MVEIDNVSVEVLLPSGEGLAEGLYDGLRGVGDDLKGSMVDSTSNTFTVMTVSVMFLFAGLFLWRTIGGQTDGGNA